MTQLDEMRQKIKSTHHARMRRKYLLNVLAFICLLGAVMCAYMVFTVPIHLPQEPVEQYVSVKPNLKDYCGLAPEPGDWNILDSSGTIDMKQSLAFADAMTQWVACTDEFAAEIRMHARGVEEYRDVIVESTGNYFLEWVEPFDDMGEHPGTFDCGSCHETMKEKR